MTTQFLDQLKQGNFETAQDLGKELNLDADVINKELWKALRESPVHSLSLEDVHVLAQVKDDAWVVTQCLETLVDDHHIQLEILRTGQQRVEEKTSSTLNAWKQSLDQLNVDDTTCITAEGRVWIQARLYFLQYLDRLSTFNIIWAATEHNSTFSTAYGEFRDANLVALALEYARTENSQALKTLFLCHNAEMLPFRLFILSQIPETGDLHDNLYLPTVTDSQEESWPNNPWRREPDLVELLLERHALDFPKAEEHKAYLDHLEHSLVATDYPAPAEAISSWYKDRAKAADKVGLCGRALEILRHARSTGVPSVERDLDDYDWLCKFVYASGAATNVITLEEFKQLPPEDVLDGLLHDTDVAHVAEDVLRLGIPWLARVKKQQKKEHVEHILYNWLLEESADHLDWCCEVIERSKPSLDVNQRIIKDDYDVSRLVLAIIYTSDGKKMEHIVTLFECLPEFENEHMNSSQIVPLSSFLPSAGSPISFFAALQSVDHANVACMLDTLQADVQSAMTLNDHHASVPFQWFLEEHSTSDRRQLCIRMASQAAGGVESGGAGFDSEDDWEVLLEDMESLLDTVFVGLNLVDIREIFFLSMLRSGAFGLARKKLDVIPSIVDLARAEALVLDAAREFFDNDQKGNMYEGNLGKARECLKVLPMSTPAIEQEQDLIKATHTLISQYKIKERGNEMMPIQVRHTKDKFTLVSKLLDARPTIYRQPMVVLELVQQLGYKDDLLAEIKMFSLLTFSLLSGPVPDGERHKTDEHYKKAYEFCKTAFEKAHNTLQAKNNEANQTAWKMCFLLGKTDEYQDLTRRLDVIGMALALSPTECIGDTLKLWRKLDKQCPNKSELMRLDLKQDNPDQPNSWPVLPKGLFEGAAKIILPSDDGSSSSQPIRKRDQVFGMLDRGFDWLTK